jgi:hypothetical protein
MPLLPMTCITANNNESAAKKRILGMALWALASLAIYLSGILEVVFWLSTPGNGPVCSLKGLIPVRLLRG